MKRKIFISIASAILAMGLHAETIRILRFVPVDGAESEVALDSLRKVVFTPDSVVLIAAKDAAPTPVYKYDYRDHSLNDDLVAPENSLQMYQWLQNNGVQQAVLDTTSLTGTHLNSATYFILHVMTDDLSNW